MAIFICEDCGTGVYSSEEEDPQPCENCGGKLIKDQDEDEKEEKKEIE